MTKPELLRLITAVETDNADHYHGELKEGIIEALKQLDNMIDIIDEVKDILKPVR